MAGKRQPRARPLPLPIPERVRDGQRARPPEECLLLRGPDPRTSRRLAGPGVRPRPARHHPRRAGGRGPIDRRCRTGRNPGRASAADRVRRPPHPLPRRPGLRRRSGGRERLDRRGPSRAACRRGRAWPGNRPAEPPLLSRPAGRAREQPWQPARRARHRRAEGQNRGLPQAGTPAHLRPGPPSGDRRVPHRPGRRQPAATRPTAKHRPDLGRASAEPVGKSRCRRGDLHLPPTPHRRRPQVGGAGGPA